MLLGMFPHHIKNYYEPFLGGGALYFAMAGKTCYVNDRNRDLMMIYRNAARRDESRFTNYFGTMAAAWKKMEAHFLGVMDELEELTESYRLGLYHDYRDFVGAVNEVVDRVTYRNIFYRIIPDPQDFKMELRHHVIQEIIQMEKWNDQSERDIQHNLLYAMKMGIYGFLTEVVNRESVEEPVRAAGLAFLLNYAADMPFKPDQFGELRPPFGVRDLTDKSLAPLVKQVKSAEFKEHLDRTTFGCDDAMDFLRRFKPKEGDFLFLDPPAEVRKDAWETDYSPVQHKRLADYLLNRCPAQWMLLVERRCSALSRYREAHMQITRVKDFDKLIIRNY